jgi:hypothetical protein
MTVIHGLIRNYGCTRPDLSPFNPTSKYDQRCACVVYFISVNLRWLGTTSDPSPPPKKKKTVLPSCITDTLHPHKKFSIRPNFVTL